MPSPLSTAIDAWLDAIEEGEAAAAALADADDMTSLTIGSAMHRLCAANIHRSDTGAALANTIRRMTGETL